MSCIFTNSKYYKQAKADPLDVAPPIGYDFLYNKPKKPQNNVPLNTGNLVLKGVFDKTHHKVLSKAKPTDKLMEFLKVSDEPGKIQNITPKLLQMVRNQISLELFLSISKQYVPHWKPEFSMIQLSQVLSNPRIQAITYIEDCSLAKYFFMYQGSDIWRIKYLYEYFNRRIIQYDIEAQLINHSKIPSDNLLTPPKSTNVFKPPTNIQNKDEVLQIIKNVNQSNLKRDSLYSGVHFYFADFTKKSMENADYFQRENLHYPMLYYYLTVMTGILGGGQTAVIKLCGVVKQKTFELIYILKLIFNKVSIVKPLGSNPFLPNAYITCEHYYKEHGDIIHNFLLENYGILKQSGEKKLLDPRKIFREDLHQSIKNFNDNVIRQGILKYFEEFKNNTNTEYYPPKNYFNFPKYAIDLDNILREMIRLPDPVGPNWDAMIEESMQAAGTTQNANNKSPTNAQKPRIAERGLFTKKKIEFPSKSKDKK